MRLFCVFATAVLCTGLVCQASTLDQQTAGVNPNANGYFGQAFTVHGSGAFTDIAFNFYVFPGTTTPYASGTGYIYSQQFFGTPAALGAVDPTLLGSAEASGGEYRFGSGLTLNGGGVYYFYAGAELPEGSISGQAEGGEFFYAANAASTFTGYSRRSNNYLLTGNAPGVGDPVAMTPEPSSFVLLGTGLLGMGAAVRRRLVSA